MDPNDLTTEQGILAWLLASDFAYGKQVVSVERLNDGFTGFVYRAHIENSDRASVIIKHAENYAARSPTWKLDQSRMHYEKQGLQYLSTLQLPPHLMIRTPHVLFYDRTAYILALEDVGRLPSLKGWLQSGTDVKVAKAVGESLGRFLAIVHNASAGAEEVKGSFNGNTTAKYLSSTLYYGRLPAVAKDFGFTDDFLHDASVVGEQEVNKSNEVLTLGDFWTGNVLIDTAAPSGFQLYVVDLELAKPGTAAFDIGQMAAEMHCLQLFRDDAAGKSLLQGFLESYRTSRDGSIAVGSVSIRIGAHMLAVTPKAWANEAHPNHIQNVVAEGVELIRSGRNRDDESLRKSVVGPLFDT